MSKRKAPIVAAVLTILAAPAGAQEAAPAGCRWQDTGAAPVMACKDAQGYWRRTGDGEVVGYDPPKRKARPAPPAPPPVIPVAAPVPAVEVPPPPVVAAPAPPAEVATPPEPPIEPKPPESPVEAFLRWLVNLWRGFQAWIASLS